MKQNLFSCRSCYGQAGAHLSRLDVALCVRDTGPWALAVGNLFPCGAVFGLLPSWALWILCAEPTANCCLPSKGLGAAGGTQCRYFSWHLRVIISFFLEDVCQLG